MGEVVVISEDGNGMELEVMETEPEAEKNGSASVPAATAPETSSIVRWERFLPKMVLRVLLVEADDSTRQIIAALLRKCSYRVAAVPDGLKAWEVLKGRPHNIDLILTEVDLPSISGFALLTLIMEHDICKNIPVIMMSTQDSVSTVYKCMLRGAADFLVKPVRKNELRNLWQHVWRRQASSSGGLGPSDESVAQQKLEATAENNAISNSSSDYMDCIQRNREGIEKGSDAQSSCTKPELDVEGIDMECLQGLPHPRQNEPLSSNMDIHKHKEHRNINNKVEVYNNEAKGLKEATGVDKNRMTCGEDMRSDDHWEHFHATAQVRETNHVVISSSREAIDLIGAFDNYLKCADRNNSSKVGINKVDSSPLLDLSLRRSLHSGSVNQVTDERHRLNHSDASAFSRYVNKTLQHSTSPSTCNQQDNHNSTSERQFPSPTVYYNPDNRGMTINSPKDIHLAAGLPKETEIGFPSPQQRSLPVPVPVRCIRFDNLSNAHGSLMVFGSQSGLSPMQSPGSVGHQEASFQVNSCNPLNHQSGDSQQFRGPINQTANDATDQSDNKEDHNLELVEERGHISSATDQSANSSFCNGTVTHLPSLGRGSNGKIDAVPFMSTAECGNEEAFGIHDGNSIRSVQREAALMKFRLKRKERCFEKKVRYESRKKLAEKRPRVKGQFVRQVQNEPPPGNSSAW